MIDRAALLADLRRQLRLLERDLAGRAEDVPAMAAALEAEYRAARAAERTGDTFGVWRAGELTQAAVAWLLGCVFVRFAEDNSLVRAPLIVGPDARNARATDRQTLYFRDHPTDTDRDYLLDVFATIARLPALAGLYDRTRNPVWRHGISGDAARDLLAFWRTVDPDTGALRHDFTDPEWDTRFLGDLYQDLSDDAKKRFALLQTPEFVEEFILDRTLTPALDEFGLAGTRLIDPACGSGHFLLGAFHRLLHAWFAREPGTPERALVQRALDSVYGVDINPFAAAIARFRLLVAALRASDIERLKDAPAFAIHVAAGDSLLHGRRFGELNLGSGAEQLASRKEFRHAFLAEDLDTLNWILGQQYHVVVGNPPYITVKDRAVNRLYRQRYSTCHRQYSLAVPFTERFFDLALPARHPQPAGYVGLITANSFMKREFGKKLVESFLPRVDLTHVIDTSGAYIPGHPTPTVILLGRHREPIGNVVRTILGIRGERGTPQTPSQGRVWSAVVAQINMAKSESEWVSSADVRRETLFSHPWRIGGGNVRQLQEAIETNTQGNETLGHIAAEIGRMTHTGEDEAFYFCSSTGRAATGNLASHCVPLVVGEDVRNWLIAQTCLSIFPYEDDSLLPWGAIPPPLEQHFWVLRTTLRDRQDFGKYIEQRGLKWFEHSMFFRRRYSRPLSIVFAFVATHNHFMLDHGGKIFNRSAPVIKLREEATEADHLSLVGLLNSSVACFWMKQVFHDKGGSGAWERRYEHTSTGLSNFPLTTLRPLVIAAHIDRLSADLRTNMPSQLADKFPMETSELDTCRSTAASLLARMTTLQEDLDWECYRLYGVIDGDYRYKDNAGNRREPPALALGERAFEVFMARRMAAGELETTWFIRHGSTPITELPAHWPDDYRALVERRIELIHSNDFIGLIETPEYKRRWNVEPWRDEELRALRNWLLDRLESPSYWREPRLATVRTLAEHAAADMDFQQVASRYAGDAGVDLTRLVAELVEDESVPALSVQRYKPSGITKRADWERTWTTQRREDAIDAEVAAMTSRLDTETAEEHAARLQAEQQRRKREDLGDLIPPPKYRSGDFLKPNYWRLRGALDVPKERFVSLPHISRDSDPTLLVGWAGWDALELCQAVAVYYTDVTEKEGWSPLRLAPLLAVLQENLPWLKQWHNDIDPAYNQRHGDFIETFLRSQLSVHGLTEQDLRTWKPPRSPTRVKRK